MTPGDDVEEPAEVDEAAAEGPPDSDSAVALVAAPSSMELHR